MDYMLQKYKNSQKPQKFQELFVILQKIPNISLFISGIYCNFAENSE